MKAHGVDIKRQRRELNVNGGSRLTHGASGEGKLEGVSPRVSLENVGRADAVAGSVIRIVGAFTRVTEALAFRSIPCRHY